MEKVAENKLVQVAEKAKEAIEIVIGRLEEEHMTAEDCVEFMNCYSEDIIKMLEDRVKFLNKTIQENKIKRYPKPEYDKCNKGHQLVEVYNEKRNSYDWDCPICIATMEKARGGQ